MLTELKRPGPSQQDLWQGFVLMENPNILVEKYPVHDGPILSPQSEELVALLTNDENTRRIITSYMSNNTPVQWRGYAIGRALSAFYFLTGDGLLIVEKGAIQGDGQAKTHDYLRRFSQRLTQGLYQAMRSGHVTDSSFGKIALVDSEIQRASSRETQQIASTLWINGYTPIGGNGYPIS